MKEPVDHILRPRLPWRDPTEPAITECGYDASKVKTISREDYTKRHKELGYQRCAMVTCMTCADTAKRWKAWSDDPREAIGREVEWETNKWRAERGTRLLDELEALEKLVANHAAEFADLVRNIRERREWNQRKEKPEKPKEPARSTWKPL